MKQYLECGKIVTTHGLKGDVKIYPWTDEPEDLLHQKTLYLDEKGTKSLTIELVRMQKDMVLCKFEGIDSEEAGRALRGKVLYLDRASENLAPGQYYVQDLLGLSVLDADDGHAYGTLTDVLKTGANDVYEVTSSEKKKTLIPAIPLVVIEKNPEEGWVKIRPIPGLFDDGEDDHAL